MNYRKKLGIFIIVLIVPASMGFAYSSGGGLTYGLQYYHPELTNQDIGLHTVGGYGYGTSREASDSAVSAWPSSANPTSW